MIRRRSVLALAADLTASDSNRTLQSLLDELGRSGAIDPTRTRVVAARGGSLAGDIARSAELNAVRVIGEGADKVGAVASRLHPNARALGERAGLAWGLARNPGQGNPGTPDVVWAHGAGSLSLAAALPRPARRAPLVVRLSEGPVTLGRLVAGDVGERLSTARLVVVATEEMQRHLVDDVGLAPHRVALHPRWLLPTSATDSLAPSWPEDSLVVAGAGPVGWASGSDLFLELVSRLPDEIDGRPVKGVWLGRVDDPEATTRWSVEVSLRELDDRVQLVDAPAWDPSWSPPTVMVVTARESPLPLLALDAARRAVPVVGTRSSGLAEVLAGSALSDATDELLVDCYDHARMAQLVADLLGDHYGRATLGAGQQAHVVRNHGAGDRVAELWADVASRLARG